VKELLPMVETHPLAIDTLGRPAPVPGGFAQEIAHGVLLYGQELNGKIVSLNIEVTAAAPDFERAQPLLQTICTRFGLDLVDWYGESFIAQAPVA
jgi:hypothetical protein